MSNDIYKQLEEFKAKELATTIATIVVLKFVAHINESTKKKRKDTQDPHLLLNGKTPKQMFRRAIQSTRVRRGLRLLATPTSPDLGPFYCRWEGRAHIGGGQGNFRPHGH